MDFHISSITEKLSLPISDDVNPWSENIIVPEQNNGESDFSMSVMLVIYVYIWDGMLEWHIQNVPDEIVCKWVEKVLGVRAANDRFW